jgi:hypothetical protein
VEFDLIVKYFNYINQAYCSQVYNVLLMEGKRNMWNPHFMAMLFHIARIERSSIWIIDMMAMGKCEPYQHNHVQWSQFLRITSRIFKCGKVIKVFTNFMLE